MVDLTPKQLVKLLMMPAFRAHLRWHLHKIPAKNLNRKMSSEALLRVVTLHNYLYEFIPSVGEKPVK